MRTGRSSAFPRLSARRRATDAVVLLAIVALGTGAAGCTGEPGTADPSAAGVSGAGSSPATGSSAVAGGSSTPVTSAVVPSDGVARLEPGDGVLVGVNLAWGVDTPEALIARLGRTPAVWVQFAAFPFGEADRANVAGFVESVRRVHGLALLTLEPSAGPAAVDNRAIGELVDVLADANAREVDVLVRFAHEMNGSWYAWGQQPAAYRDAFRRVATAVHDGAPRSAMLWAPNDGGGYPFAGGRYEAAKGTPAFVALDTNHDGQLDMADDPYEPYYPGDDAVDWVGMSLYHWGDRWPWGRNVLPESGKFAAKLTGTYAGTAGDERGLPDFYAEYAVRRGKPMAIPETAAFYRPSLPTGATEASIKGAWWRQVFSSATLRDFPRIRIIDWFEQRKVETEVSDVVDWRLTSSPELARSFLADLPAGFRFLSEPGD